MQHKQRCIFLSGQQYSQWGTYEALLTEACARHLVNSQHAHNEVLRRREIRVKVRAIAHLFGFSAEDVLNKLTLGGGESVQGMSEGTTSGSSSSGAFPAKYDDFVASVVKCEQDWGTTESSGGEGVSFLAFLSDSFVRDSPDGSLMRLQLVNRAACSESHHQGQAAGGETSNRDFALSWLASRSLASYVRPDALRQVHPNQALDQKFVFSRMEEALGLSLRESKKSVADQTEVEMWRIWAYLGSCSRMQIDLTLSEVIKSEISPQQQTNIGGDSFFFFDHGALVPNLLSLTFFLLHLGRVSLKTRSGSGGPFRPSLDVLGIWRENRSLIVAPALTHSLGFYLESLLSRPMLTSNYSAYITTVTQMIASLSSPAQTAGHLIAGVFDSKLYKSIVEALLNRQESQVLLSALMSALTRCLCVLCEPLSGNIASPARRGPATQPASLGAGEPRQPAVLPSGPGNAPAIHRQSRYRRDPRKCGKTGSTRCCGELSEQGCRRAGSSVDLGAEEEAVDEPALVRGWGGQEGHDLLSRRPTVMGQRPTLMCSAAGHCGTVQDDYRPAFFT